VDSAPDLRIPRLSLARLTPRRLLHLPSRTVRLRLTLLYGGLFLVSGLALLATTYLLFRGSTGVDLIVPTGLPHGSAGPGHNGALPNPEVLREVTQRYAQAVARNTQGLHQGLIQSGIALAIMTVVSIALGWLVAGRVLRPLRTITTTRIAAMTHLSTACTPLMHERSTSQRRCSCSLTPIGGPSAGSPSTCP